MELREALEAATAEQETNNAVQVQEPSTESAPAAEPEQSADTTVSEPESSGAVPVELAETAQKPDISKPAPAKADEPLAPGQHRVDRAPASWRKEAKGEWAAVPLHIRQEVHRRELEVNRALNDAAQARQNAEQFTKIVEPYMARIQSSGVTPQQAIGHLLQADYTLATASKSQRAQFMAKLIKDYDVDIGELDSAIVGNLQGQQQLPGQPDIQALVQQQLQQALAPIYQERQQAQLAQQQQVTQTVEQMTLDPKYPYFEDVRQDMADLIEVAARRGIALSLEDAYSRAILMNPQAQQSMQQQTATQQANQQNLQAQRAKAASSSVTGAPASGGSGQFSGDGSVRGALEAAFANIRV